MTEQIQIIQSNYAVSSRSKKIGKWLIWGPIAGLIVTILVSFIISIVVGVSGSSTSTFGVDSSIAPTGVGGSNPLLGFLGGVISFLSVFFMFAIMICLPLGIIYLTKKDLVEGVKYDERSGKKSESIIPEEIKGWNWGAAGLPTLWGIYNSNLWIFLVMTISILVLYLGGIIFIIGLIAHVDILPFLSGLLGLGFLTIICQFLVSLILPVFLGIKGNELAWKAEKWESVESFKAKQNRWKIWGIIFLIPTIIQLYSIIISFFR